MQLGYDPDHDLILLRAAPLELIEHEDKSKAIELVKKGLTYDPVDAALLAALGRFTRHLGGDDNEKEGKRLIELAREIDPDDVDTWLLVEDALEAVDNPPTPTPGAGMDGGDSK